MGRTHDAFAKPKYLALTTFRKDGRAVSTPVWFAHDGDRLVVITGRESGKAKRIRNGSRVLVAPCDMRGRPKGEAVEAVGGPAGSRRDRGDPPRHQEALRHPGPIPVPRLRPEGRRGGHRDHPRPGRAGGLTGWGSTAVRGIIDASRSPRAPADVSVGMRGLDGAPQPGSASRGCRSGLVNKAAKRSNWQPPACSRPRCLGSKVSVEAASPSWAVEASFSEGATPASAS